MSKFNYFRSEITLRREGILIRLIHKEGMSISNLLLYRKKQELVEDALNTFNRKKRRRSGFNGLRYIKNLKRKKIKKDILDWSFRRLPLT